MDFSAASAGETEISPNNTREDKKTYSAFIGFFLLSSIKILPIEIVYMTATNIYRGQNMVMYQNIFEKDDTYKISRIPYENLVEVLLAIDLVHLRIEKGSISGKRAFSGGGAV